MHSQSRLLFCSDKVVYCGPFVMDALQRTVSHRLSQLLSPSNVCRSICLSNAPEALTQREKGGGGGSTSPTLPAT